MKDLLNLLHYLYHSIFNKPQYFPIMKLIELSLKDVVCNCYNVVDRSRHRFDLDRASKFLFPNSNTTFCRLALFKFDFHGLFLFTERFSKIVFHGFIDFIGHDSC